MQSKEKDWGICNGDICYGNPPLPWNLLATQEESFRFYSHDCTISAGLIEWQKMQLIPLSSLTHTHTPALTHLHHEGRIMASCLQFLNHIDPIFHLNFNSSIFFPKCFVSHLLSMHIFFIHRLSSVHLCPSISFLKKKPSIEGGGERCGVRAKDRRRLRRSGNMANGVTAVIVFAAIFCNFKPLRGHHKKHIKPLQTLSMDFLHGSAIYKTISTYNMVVWSPAMFSQITSSRAVVLQFLKS